MAEDDWWGARAADGDVDMDAPSIRDAIVDKYFRRTASAAVSPRAPRQAWLLDQFESASLDGVIFYVPPSDKFFGWDYPALKARLDDAGIPSLLVRTAIGDASGTDAITRFVTGLQA